MLKQLSHTFLLGPASGRCTAHSFCMLQPTHYERLLRSCQEVWMSARCRLLWQKSKKWRKEAKGDMSILFGKLGVLRRKPLWRKDGENEAHVTESYLSWSCTVRSPWNQLQRHVSVLETGPSKAGKSQGCRAGHLGTLRDAGWGASLQGTDGCEASAWEAQDHACVLNAE